MAVLIGMMLSIFVGTILVSEFETVIDNQRVGASLDFNNTADKIVQFTWIGFTFFAIGILIVVGRWILAQTGLLGGVV